MAVVEVFMDESGDMGFTLDQPRLKGGSSRYLVLAAIVVPYGHNIHLERLVRELYIKRGRAAGKELKSTDLNGPERKKFALSLKKLQQKYPGFTYHAVAVEKANVNHGLSSKPEILYNHMAERMLHVPLSKYAAVEFFPDARAVKAWDKHALHNCLETQLAIAGHRVDIRTEPRESGLTKEIQAADFLASIVWAKYEENNPLFDTELLDSVELLKLY